MLLAHRPYFCALIGVEKLISLPLTEAKKDANNRYQRINSAHAPNEKSSMHSREIPTMSQNSKPQDFSHIDIIEPEIKETYRSGMARAWAPQINKPDPSMYYWSTSMYHIIIIIMFPS